MSKSDTSPDVTNHFSALMRQPAAVRSAVPAIPPASEPAAPSVTAYESARSPRSVGFR
jgi:hypothetical protein